jgi:uncharacterized membrane protein YgaE (UPF0421/DUF939 family)
MPFGLRTVKTAVAIIFAMIVVDFYGATTSKLIFAMLGAMTAVQPTFQESLEASLAQIVGVLFGSVAGIGLLSLPLPPLVLTGIGIILVITLYNALRIRFDPSLPCFIVVMLCVTEDIVPMEYAAGRIWDTAIGLLIGLLINTLVFPYDNSRQIRATAESLDRELLRFLEDMFDGDEALPNAAEMKRRIDTMRTQLSIFSKQRLFLNLRRQKQQLESFRLCEQKARELVARMEVLCSMGRPGRLTAESRRRLASCGADIQDTRPLDAVLERDVVTNYHITQILRLRRELLEVLKK